MKVVLSTGIGRLHLVEAAKHLSDFGHEVHLVQGWVPRRMPDAILNTLGAIAGSRHLAFGMRKRIPDNIPAKNLHNCAFAEFYAQGLRLSSRSGLISRGKASRFGWQAFGRSSRRYLAQHEVFHVRSGAGQGGAIKKAKSLGIPVIVDHSIAHPAFMERAVKSEFDRLGQELWIGPNDPFWSLVLEDCKQADLLLVNSNFVRDTFVEEGWEPDRIRVVHQGTRMDFLGLKNSYKINSTPTLLFTGAFGGRKGANYLIDAMVNLNATRRFVELNVLGDCSEVAPVGDAQTQYLGINLKGFVPQDDLKDYLKSSDLYVFPSLAEGCASSGIEAMAAGLPVIATKESGLPIVHGENGWLIDSHCAGSIKAAVTYLIEQPDLREHLGKNASTTIAEECSWENYARSVTKIYDEVGSLVSDRKEVGE